MELHNIKKIKGNKGKSKRLGRGRGSGKGDHTVGRGTKGQGARSGNSLPVGFEGGQTPLYKRLPRFGGFRNPTSKQTVAISLSKLNVFRSGQEISAKNLVTKGIIKKVPKHGVKILASGEIKKKLKLRGFLFSEAAKKRIEGAGCEILNE